MPPSGLAKRPAADPLVEALATTRDAREEALFDARPFVGRTVDFIALMRNIFAVLMKQSGDRLSSSTIGTANFLTELAPTLLAPRSIIPRKGNHPAVLQIRSMRCDWLNLLVPSELSVTKSESLFDFHRLVPSPLAEDYQPQQVCEHLR